MNPSVFVTVGTTSFDDLIAFTNSPEFHAALWRLGYRDIVIQYGGGAISPCVPTQSAISKAAVEMGYTDNVQALSIMSFRYDTSLDDYFKRSSLVISHGGSGSCLQALRTNGNRRLIIVTNDSLSNNHQEELASELVRGRFALTSRIDGLLNLLWHGVSTDIRYQELGLFTVSHLFTVVLNLFHEIFTSPWFVLVDFHMCSCPLWDMGGRQSPEYPLTVLAGWLEDGSQFHPITFICTVP